MVKEKIANCTNCGKFLNEEDGGTFFCSDCENSFPGPSEILKQFESEFKFIKRMEAALDKQRTKR
jgi:predicted RNA-binding Zn-ribbon protein involved in translation (DUF1610 family)